MINVVLAIDGQPKFKCPAKIVTLIILIWIFHIKTENINKPYPTLTNITLTQKKS